MRRSKERRGRDQRRTQCYYSGHYVVAQANTDLKHYNKSYSKVQKDPKTPLTMTDTLCIAILTETSVPIKEACCRRNSPVPKKTLIKNRSQHEGSELKGTDYCDIPSKIYS